MITLSQTVKQVQEGIFSKGASVSKVIRRPVYEVVRNMLKFTKSLVRLTIIQLAQWDDISRGRKMIENA